MFCLESVAAEAVKGSINLSVYWNIYHLANVPVNNWYETDESCLAKAPVTAHTSSGGDGRGGVLFWHTV